MTTAGDTRVAPRPPGSVGDRFRAATAQLSDPYAAFMLAPVPGAGVCSRCFNLTDGYSRCYACEHGGDWLAAMLPISYSVAGERLHEALAGYKRLCGVLANRYALELAAVLERHMTTHESCLTRAAGVDGFEIVTTVPSSDAERDRTSPLRVMAGALVPSFERRYERLLVRSGLPADAHEYSPAKFELRSQTELAGRAVLLVDDTWTTGANAQSAAAALRAAGASAVGAVVIGRHVNRWWRENDRVLGALASPFDWSRCALCPVHEGGDEAASHD